MNTSPEDIKNNVLEKIRQGDIRMRPRIYFVAQIVAVIVVAIFALIVSAFVVSFAFFSVHESGELFLLGFGFRGLLTFFSLFPWFTLIVAVGLIFLFEWLLRHFKFNYSQPILKIFFAFLCIIFIGGLFISLTPLHIDLLYKADKGRLPFFGELYENIRTPHENTGEFRGVVVSVATSTLTITHNDNDADADDGTRIVVIPPGFDINQLHIGDRVYVAGDIASNTIAAYGLGRF